jgi:hypothetical protein
LSAPVFIDHRDCRPDRFCRNPLHPGPCKGWKGTLAKVAPGALKIIEEARREKLAARKAAKLKAAEHAAKKSKPQVDDGGFEPGKWDVETREAAVEAAYQKALNGWHPKAATPEQREARARKAAEQMVPPGWRMYRNGNVSLEVRDDVPEQHQSLALRAIEGLQATNPRPSARVSLRRIEGDKAAIGGVAFPGSDVLALNAPVMSDQPWGDHDGWFVPAAGQVSQIEYAMAHEWGHLVSHATGLNGHATEGPGVSKYGHTNADESYAELFADYYHGSTRSGYDNPAARSAAHRYGWTNAQGDMP